MDFASYAKRAQAFDLRALSEDSLRKLARLFDRGMELKALHTRYGRELGGHDLATFRHAREVWHEHRRWQQSVREMVSQRSAAERLLLPDDAIRSTWTRTGLALIEAVDERLNATVFDSHAAWTGTLTLAATTWQNAMAACLTQGHLGSGEDAVILSEVSATQWCAARASHPGVDIHETFSLPDLPEVQDAGPHLERLVDLEAEEVTAWLNTQVAELIPTGIAEVMDRQAVVRSVIDCARHFEALLAIKPIQGDCVRALFCQGQEGSVGLAVVQRDGVVRGATTVDSDVDISGIMAWMVSSAADDDTFVVPASAEAQERVAALAEALGDDAPMVSVLAYGLPDLQEKSASFDLGELPEAKAAVALAMRAYKPRRLWQGLDATEVVTAELQLHLEDDDRERLVTAMGEIRSDVLGDEAPVKASQKAPSKESGSRRPNRDRGDAYNPEIKNLSDLEPGMQLKGRVANLNRFGAFVDVGIPKEGLIPMHALTQGFTTSPSDVVKNGQEVHVTVQTIDRSRGRFDLSVDKILPMQPGDEQAGARKARSGGRGGRGGRGGQGGRGGRSGRRGQGGQRGGGGGDSRGGQQ